MPTPLDLDDIEGTICTGIDTDDRQTMTENHEAHAGLDVLIARVRQLEDECDRLRATGAEHQRAIVELAEEYNRRDAVTAELRATLANERGEGEGPSEGWTWASPPGRWGNPNGWSFIVRGLSFAAVGRNADGTGWDWHAVVWQALRGGQGGTAPTAREAMRAVDLARAGGAP